MHWLLVAALLAGCHPTTAEESRIPAQAIAARYRWGVAARLSLGLRGGRGPGAVPTRVPNPAARDSYRPASRVGLPSAARLPTVLLTPGVYPLRVAACRDEDAPALEPLPLPVTGTPPLLPGGPPFVEPRYASRQPLYARLPLGEVAAGVLVALDESGGAGSGYDRLYFDARLDGNLAAAAPVEGRIRRAGAFVSVEFDCPTMPALYESAAASSPLIRRTLRVRIHGYRLGDAPWRFRYELAERRVGQIPSSSGPVQVVLADSAMRGDFSRRCAYHSAVPTVDGAGPQLWLSPNPTAPEALDPLRLSLGTAQLLGGLLYRFEPTATGDQIAVRLYTGDAGRARIEAANARQEALPVTQITLLGGAGRYEIDSGVAEQALPPGDYFAITSIEQPDEEGEWTLRFRSRAPFRLPAAADTQVAIGGVLRALISPGVQRLVARRGEILALSLSFVSAAGHELVDLEGPEGAGYATVVVRSAAGRVVARSRSGFG
jgi:hypothetical protein